MDLQTSPNLSSIHKDNSPNNLSPIANSNVSRSPNLTPAPDNAAQSDFLNHLISTLLKALGPTYLFQNFFPKLDNTRRKTIRRIPKDILQDLDSLRTMLDTNDLTNLLNPTPDLGVSSQLFKIIEIFSITISDEAKECFNLDEFEDSQFLYPIILEIINTILTKTKGLTIESIVPLLCSMLPGLTYFEDDYLLQMLQLVLDFSMPQSDQVDHQFRKILTTLFIPLITGLLNRYGSFRYLSSVQPKIVSWLDNVIRLWPESFVQQLMLVASQPSHTDMRRAIFDLLIYICPNIFGRNRIAACLNSFHLTNILGSDIDIHLRVPFNLLPFDHPHLLTRCTSESRCFVCEQPSEEKDIFLCTLTDQLVHRDCIQKTLKYISDYSADELAPTDTIFYSSAHTFQQYFTRNTIDPDQHLLIKANFFQTEVCSKCVEPIWGINHQGYICTICHSRYHDHCCDEPGKCTKSKVIMDTSSISSDKVKQSLNNFISEMGLDLNPSANKLDQFSTDHLKLIYHFLYLQNILNIHSAYEPMKNFWPELLPLIDSIKSHLEKKNENGPSLLLHRMEQSKLLIRFFQLNSEKCSSGTIGEIDPNVYELLSDFLYMTLKLSSKKLSYIIIQNMASMGVLILAYPKSITSNFNYPKDKIYFPVDFTCIETFTVRQILYLIEGCLFEVNLSMNEHALILLKRRCNPYYTSRAVQSHLMKLVITWFHRQDIVMSIIHKEFASKKTAPPGIFLPSEINDDSYKDGGTIYLNKRIALTEHYLVSWFNDLECADPQMDRLAYDIYSIVKELCDSFVKLADIDKVEKKQLNFQICESIVKFLMKLQKSNLISVKLFDKLLDLWRMDYYKQLKDEIVTPQQTSQLCKFFLATLNKSVETSDQSGSMNLPELRTNSHLTTLIKKTVTQENDYNLSSALSWLDILATAGLTVDSPHSYFGSITCHPHFDLECMNILLSIILQNMVATDVPMYSQEQLCTLLYHLKKHIHFFELGKDHIASHLHQTSLEYIIAICGLIYGCSLDHIKFFELSSINRVIGSKSGMLVFKPEPNQSTLMVDHVDAGTQFLTQLVHFDNVMINSFALTGILLLVQHSYFGLDNVLTLIGTDTVFLKKLWIYSNPNYGNISFTTIAILLEIANKYPDEVFQAIRFEVNDGDKDAKWHWLDSMLGLITHVNSDALRKYPNLYKSMGPLINDYIGTLKSDTEYLRTKFQVYSKSITERNAEFIFKLWGLYFDSSNLEFRIPTLKLMIYANNLFPKWPVLSWKSIFGVLSLFPEVKIGEKIGAFDIDELPKKHYSPTASTDQVEREEYFYTPSNIDEDLKILVLNLAFQLIAHGVPINKQEINFLKLLIANLIGISGAKMVVNKDKEYEIIFDNYKFDPQNTNNLVVLQTFISSIKPVLDNIDISTVDPIEENIEEVDQTEPTSQISKSIGNQFLKLILKIFNSNLITQELSHFMLKDLLEALAIIVYKYDIENPAISPLIIQAVKKISKMLTAAVSEENQHTILNICMIVLKRSSKLASSMLSSQIETMSYIVARLAKNSEDLIAHKARRFLALAFSSYATNGLFILIFKNHNYSESNGELFTAFRIVLESADSMIENERGIMVPLRDQPIQDVVNRLLSLNNSASDKKAFENILANTAHYVRLVHSKGYGEKVLNDFFAFLDKLSSRIYDWSYQELNMTYAIEIIAIVLKNHIFASDIILPKVRVFLKNVISKFFISCNSLTSLLEAVQKCNSNKLEVDIVNFANIILTELNLGLMRRKPLLPANGLIDLIKTIYHTPSGIEESETQIQTEQETEDWNDLLARLSQKSEFYAIFQEFPDNIITNIIGYIEDPESAVKNSNGGFVACLWSSYFWTTMYFQNRSTLSDTKHWLNNLDIKRSILSANWFFLSLCHHADTNHLETIILYQDYIIEIFQDGFNQPSSLLRDTSITSNSQPLYMYPGQLQQFMFILLRTWVALYSLHAHSEFVKKDSPNKNGGETDEPYFVSSMERNFWMFIWPLIIKKLGIDMLMEDDTVDPATCSMFSTLFVELVIFLVQCRSDIFVLYSREWKHTLESIATRDRVLASDAKFILAMSLFDKHLPPLPPAKMVDQLFKELNAAISP